MQRMHEAKQNKLQHDECVKAKKNNVASILSLNDSDHSRFAKFREFSKVETLVSLHKVTNT